MASRKVTLILEFGDLKNKLKVDGSTPPLELKKLAADKCNITNPVTLLYHDTDVKEWFVVDEDYELTDKDTLKLVFVDEKGNIVKNPVESKPKDAATIEGNGATSMQNDAAVAEWKASIEELISGNPRSQGIVFIEEMSSAAGANKDGRKMEIVFEKLNFAVFRMTNLPANRMKALTRAIAAVAFPKLKKFYKYIAFYFAGHGGINRSNGGSFIQAVKQGNESDRVYVSSEIINVIQLGQKEKRLLFFFDCCMSVAPEDGRDPPDINVTGSNILVARASSFGEKSFGVKDGGGFWTSTLCKYLGQDELLIKILDDTNIEVRNKYGQHCNYYNTGFSSPINLKASVKPEEESLLKKEPKHDHVIHLLQGYIYQYDTIGQLLGVNFATRQRIKRDFTIPDGLEKMNSIVNEWKTTQTSDVTWEHFIQAMKNGTLMKLAGEITRYIEKEEIKQKYADDDEWVHTR